MSEMLRNPNLSLPEKPAPRPNEVLQKFGKTWWTGLPPERTPGFDVATQSLKGLPLLNLQICTREDMLAAFDNSWTLTELLFACLKDEKTYVRSPYHQLRHPPIFYYGHPAVLFINKMRLAGLLQEPIDLYLEKILETGVDEMSWDDMSKNEMQWPSVAAVHAYRKVAYAQIKTVILNHPPWQPGELGWNHPLWAVLMGIEHEKIHFETSSVLFRELPLALVETPRFFPPMASTVSSGEAHNPWVTFAAEKVVRLGKSRESTPSYGWDNEYGVAERRVKPFQVQQNLVSNREYYEFVRSLAYVDDQYWSAEGLAWRKFRNSKRPCFWVGVGPEGSHEYGLRTLFDVIPMPWDWPAEVNFHEAQAYCRWYTTNAGNSKQKPNLIYRLPSEAEHHAMRANNSVDSVLQRKSPLALQPMTENFNFQFHTPCNTQQNSPNEKNIRDVFGNVWQWHMDHFHPLDQFAIHPLYDDFSTPCFDGRHQMILGGSFISCGHEASHFARFHFRPHFFQHAGFRMAASLDGSAENGAIYLDQDPDKIHGRALPTLSEIKQNKNWWKQLSQPLELSPTELELLWKTATDKLLTFEKNRGQMSPSGSQFDFLANKLTGEYRSVHPRLQQFPRKGTSLKELLKHVETDLVPIGQQPGHPGYLAYVAGAANPIAPMAQALALTYNQFTGHHSLAPGFVEIEREVIDWLTKMVGFDPTKAGGYFTSGGSLANQSALAFARNHQTKETDQAKLTFYASQEAHHCIGKGLAFLGVPKDNLRLIKTDAELRMNLTDLKDQIAKDRAAGMIPIAVIGTMGSTPTGTLDPLAELAELCLSENVWFHIDAAYGGFFLLTEEFAHLQKATSQAHSIALDPHKSMSMPYGTGCLIVQNRAVMNLQYQGATTYMPPEPEQDYDYADVSPELSRDPRGLRMWLPLMVYGIEPFILNLDEKRALINHLQWELQKNSSIELLKTPDLTILNFRHKNPEKTQQLLAEINRSREFFLTPCKVHGQFVIRICLLGYRTHFQHIERLLLVIEQSCKKV